MPRYINHLPKQADANRPDRFTTKHYHRYVNTAMFSATLFVTLVCTFWLGYASSLTGQASNTALTIRHEAAPSAASHPIEVQTAVYILNLGKYEIATGSFTVDYYLSLKARESFECNFEFMNGRATSQELIINKPEEKFYRILATLNSPVDLQRFPFDAQKMQIILEDKKKTSSELVFVPFEKETGMDKSIYLSGWKLENVKAAVMNHHYDIYGETYSQFSLTVNISRVKLNAFFKTFVPVIAILLVALFSFIMDLDKITIRITMATSSLVGAVMFHNSISNQIPPVGYLTNADKFMIMIYAILLATVVTDVLMLQLLQQGKSKLVQRWHALAKNSVFIVVTLAMVLFFMIIR
jgi:hypothetical protein